MSQARTAGVSSDTFRLGLASLFADVASEMLRPVLPIFLTQTLGATPSAVGLVEGVGLAAQNLVQPLSGWISDRRSRRKPIALLGYGLGAIAKPLIGLSGSSGAVAAARALERLGSGIRSAPRDALLAASASESHRGRAFGLEGIGDNLGACLGPLLALALLGAGQLELRALFLVAVLPGALAALMVALVREPNAAAPVRAAPRAGAPRLPRAYWNYLAATAVFALGNSGSAFLVLRTQELEASLAGTIAIYALFNFVAALSSYPAGALADRFGRKIMLLVALLVFAVVYAGFALGAGPSAAAALFALYGVHQGVLRSVGRALASELVPPERRASGVGGYTATLGVAGLVASSAGGLLWTRFGPAATFALGAGSALLGAVALGVLLPKARVHFADG